MDMLIGKKCGPCEGGTPPMKREQFTPYLGQIEGWDIVQDDHALERDLKFKDFKAALAFVNKVGDLAESEGHHPDIAVHNWNRVKLTLSTHAIKGLSINDFILAAKINAL
jgi:4a-hydroxytetrahydrobiopterin dehydratase